MSSTIPFIEARFMRHLRKLRCRRIPPDLLAPPDEIDALGEIPDLDPMGIIRFSDDDEARIKRRVNRIIERRKAASGLEHLKRDDRERLELLKDGARLISIRNEHHADELAAALHEDMPWMRRPRRWSGTPRAARGARALRASGSRHSSSPAPPALAKAVSAEILPRCWPHPTQ